MRNMCLPSKGAGAGMHAVEGAEHATQAAWQGAALHAAGPLL